MLQIAARLKASNDGPSTLRHVTSPQTLCLEDRRRLSAWAADCAERVLALYEAEAPSDGRPRQAIDAARSFARGEVGAAHMILARGGGKGPQPDVTRVAASAGRAAGQALAVAHMGAHALGAAAYACQAVFHAEPEKGQLAWTQEIQWQVAHMTPDVRDALRQLPPVGEPGGPLGPGLLSRGLLGESIQRIQSTLGST